MRRVLLLPKSVHQLLLMTSSIHASFKSKEVLVLLARECAPQEAGALIDVTINDKCRLNYQQQRGQFNALTHACLCVWWLYLENTVVGVCRSGACSPRSFTLLVNEERARGLIRTVQYDTIRYEYIWSDVRWCKGKIGPEHTVTRCTYQISHNDYPAVHIQHAATTSTTTMTATTAAMTRKGMCKRIKAPRDSFGSVSSIFLSFHFLLSSRIHAHGRKHAHRTVHSLLSLSLSLATAL